MQQHRTVPDITEQMVAKAITKLSRKAEGLDGMGADILKKSWAGWLELRFFRLRSVVT